MIHPLHTLGCRLRAARHELRCWECRVTWTSWAQRLAGMKRGYTPRLPKQQRALVERARRAEDLIERVRALCEQPYGAVYDLAADIRAEIRESR